ncbi:hypothetical protein IJ182_02120 [bacterium]|nr:hypothetical protein [bacterium]
MAKTKVITKPITADELIIEPESKDTIWTIDNIKTIKLKATPTGDYFGLGSMNESYTISVQEGNNLVLITKFISLKNNSIKTVKNTIKDYFKTDEAQIKLYDIDNENYADLTEARIFSSVNGITYSDAPSIATLEKDTKTRFYGSKKADTYNLRNYSGATSSNKGYVYDEAGNDKYIAISANYDIYDFKGNDYYNTYSATLEIKDFVGKDKYIIDNAKADILDYAGNDIYTLNTTSGGSIIRDYKGNDKYSVLNTSASATLYDNAGNDKYDITGSSVSINEYDFTKMNKSGNDVYNIYNSYFNINEESKNSGNDTYNINITDGSSIHDKAGNDKYNISKGINLTFEDNSGNDKYNFNFTANSEVYDSKGNDNYILKNSQIEIFDSEGKDNYLVDENSSYVSIYDNLGNDTYKIKDSTRVLIEDNGKSNDKYVIDNVNNFYNTNTYHIDDVGGNDTYSVSDSRNIKILDRAITVLAEKKHEKNTFNIKNSDFEITVNNEYTSSDPIKTYSSSDTYNIVSSSGSIVDKDFDSDTYNISKLVSQESITVTDKGGTKDKLTLKDVSKSNLVFMANVGESGYEDNSLILYNKSNGSYITINDFFTSATPTNIDGFGEGKIETIVAGKKTVSVDYNYINQVRAEAATFLSTGDTVAEILQNQNNNAETISQLIACFTKNS